MKIIKCEVYSRWNCTLEFADLTITSPKGGYVRIDKSNIFKLDDDQWSLVKKCLDVCLPKNEPTADGQVELTIDEMNKLIVIGKTCGECIIV